MINYATINDLNEILEVVYTLNNKPTFYSGYMSLSKDSITNDLKAAILNNAVLIYKDKVIKGVLITHENTEHVTYDIAGPYVEDSVVEIGTMLLKYWLEHSKKNYTHQFFFSKDSRFYKTLMEKHLGTYQGNEMILLLEKEAFKPVDHVLSVSVMKPEEKEAVKTLHDTVFPGVYISGKDVVESSSEKTVYVLKEDDQVIGYGLIKTRQGNSTLEVFAIDQQYRGKKLSKPFISSIISQTFSLESVNNVDLVVENLNEVALNLYITMGFKLKQENVSYHIKP